MYYYFEFQNSGIYRGDGNFVLHSFKANIFERTDNFFVKFKGPQKFNRSWLQFELLLKNFFKP